jgi:cell division ATPase FtsA
MVLQEIKRSGYDGLLPAGMVLTGGVSNLPGIRTLASEVLGLPVRNLNHLLASKSLALAAAVVMLLTG